MTFSRGARAPANTIKLALDPLTFDLLKAAAGTRRDTMERTAYLALQAWLAQQDSTTPAEATSAEEPVPDIGSFAAFAPRPAPRNGH